MYDDKFIYPYIEFINKNFISEEHLFFIINGKVGIENSAKNIINYEYKNRNEILKLILRLYKLCKNSNKIIFHSLFNKSIILFLYFFRNFLKKSYWVIWGGDLYNYKVNRKSYISKIFFKIEKIVKKSFYGYITEFKGDYELAIKWYGAKGKHFDCFMYPSNYFEEIKENLNKKIEGLNIMVGNSADPSNNHIEIFEKIKYLKNEKIKIYCPLSYGDKKYAEIILKKGKEIFKENFIGIIDFLNYNDYCKILSRIDVAIYAHNRQQAFGNITSLLGMKKTVYLKKEVTTYRLLKELGVIVKDFNILKEIEFISEEEGKKNYEIIKNRFSEKKLIQEWRNIFEEKSEGIV